MLRNFVLSLTFSNSRCFNRKWNTSHSGKLFLSGEKKSILTWLIYNFSGFPIWIGWGKVFQKIACQNLNKLKGLGVFLLGKLCFPWYLDQKWFCPRCFAHTSQDKVSCFMWAPGRPENIRIYFFSFRISIQNDSGMIHTRRNYLCCLPVAFSA